MVITTHFALLKWSIDNRIFKHVNILIHEGLLHTLNNKKQSFQCNSIHGKAKSFSHCWIYCNSSSFSSVLRPIT